MVWCLLGGCREPFTPPWSIRIYDTGCPSLKADGSLDFKPSIFQASSATLLKCTSGCHQRPQVHPRLAWMMEADLPVAYSKSSLLNTVPCTVEAVDVACTSTTLRRTSFPPSRPHPTARSNVHSATYQTLGRGRSRPPHHWKCCTHSYRWSPGWCCPPSTPSNPAALTGAVPEESHWSARRRWPPSWGCPSAWCSAGWCCAPCPGAHPGRLAPPLGELKTEQSNRWGCCQWAAISLSMATAVPLRRQASMISKRIFIF